MTQFKVYSDTGYGMVMRAVMRDETLSVTSKAVYSYLCSFAGSTGKAFPSTGLMASELGLSKDTLFKYLKELRDRKVVIVEKERAKGGKFGRNVYYINNNYKDIPPCPKIPDTVKPDTETPDTVSLDTNINNTNSNNVISNNVIKDNSQAKARREIPYKEIMEYLNEKTGRNFNYKAAGNRKFIKARANEGYTLDDFKKVIDIKVAEWTGTEWEKYLQASTLFGNKFDNYLNQEVKNGKSSKSNGVDEIFGFGFEI